MLVCSQLGERQCVQPDQECEHPQATSLPPGSLCGGLSPPSGLNKGVSQLWEQANPQQDSKHPCLQPAGKRTLHAAADGSDQDYSHLHLWSLTPTTPFSVLLPDSSSERR